jgi:hypothetical protein
MGNLAMHRRGQAKGQQNSAQPAHGAKFQHHPFSPEPLLLAAKRFLFERLFEYSILPHPLSPYEGKNNQKARFQRTPQRKRAATKAALCMCPSSR